MVVQKFKILLKKKKRTVRGSALVTLSDKKQGFAVSRGKQRCMENGLCNICKFLYVFILFVFTTNLILSTRQDFFYSVHFEKLSLRNRRLIEKIILIWVDLSVTTTIKRRNVGPVWDKPVPDRRLCFCPKFLSFVDDHWLLLANAPFKNLWWINCLGWHFVHCGRIHFTFTKIMNKLISTRRGVFISLVGPTQTGKMQLVFKWLKSGTIQPDFDKI